MAKITISDITAAFGSNTAINAKFQQIEDELNNKVLYRANPVGETNTMANDLDMAGFDILNINSAEITTQIGYAEEWAQKAEDSAVSAAAGGGAGEYSALHHSAKAADQVTLAQAEVTLATAQVALADTARTGAETAESGAQVAQAAAELALDTFDDRYLGSFASAPTTDNDGVILDASDEGIEYWNSTTKDRWTWDGAVWGLTSSSVATSANNVSVADAGGFFTGVNVEAVLQEIGATGLAFTTFTPTLAGETTAGTGWTYTTQVGQLYQTNSFALFLISIQITAVGAGAAGNLRIEGLPTGADEVTPYSIGSVSSIINNAASGLTHTAGYTDWYIQGANSPLNDLYIKETGVSGARFLDAATDIGASTSITVSALFPKQ